MANPRENNSSYFIIVICMLFNINIIVSSTTAEVGSFQNKVITNRSAIFALGSKAVLPCKYFGRPNTVFWSRGESISEVQGLVYKDFTSGERGGTEYDSGSYNITSDLALSIKNVTKLDQGRYFCQVSDLETRQIYRNYTDVSVYEPLFTIPNVTAWNGSTVTLPCNFTGSAQLVYWTKEKTDNTGHTEEIILLYANGVYTVPGDSRYSWNDNFSLNISNLTALDGANFTCHVSKSDGTVLQNTTLITVNVPAGRQYLWIEQCKRHVFRKDGERYCAFEVNDTSGKFQLNCSVLGTKSHPKILWSQIGQQEDRGVDKIPVISRQGPDGTVVSTATIESRITASHSQKMFRCSAEGLSDLVNGSADRIIVVRFAFDIILASPPFIRFRQCEKYVLNENGENQCAYEVIESNKHFRLHCSVYGAKPKPVVYWLQSDCMQRNVTDVVTYIQQPDGSFNVTAEVSWEADKAGTTDVFYCTAEGLSVNGMTNSSITVYYISDENINVTVVLLSTLIALIVLLIISLSIYHYYRKSQPQESSQGDAMTGTPNMPEREKMAPDSAEA